MIIGLHEKDENHWCRNDQKHHRDQSYCGAHAITTFLRVCYLRYPGNGMTETTSP